ncbi:hypothetical protein GGD56_007117 [Rhizobium mongolense]|uniref:Uncharacterized protein n=2 Tax=Rhizobium mongolense TaxID=57676 RepID=A0ABR6IZ76_9HYPH|nr:hypothetical protein [Rhizobium mongolense]TVZ75166.1 hypothetical protein BCL32_0598 [Rhizobium mongolense USDA 1844]
MMYGALFVSGLVACVMMILVIGHEAKKTDNGAPQSAVYGHQS